VDSDGNRIDQRERVVQAKLSRFLQPYLPIVHAIGYQNLFVSKRPTEQLTPLNRSLLPVTW
jgi:hypothetical protein